MSTSGREADSDEESFSISEAPSESSRSVSHCLLAYASCFAFGVAFCGLAATATALLNDGFVFTTSVSEGGGRREIVFVILALFVLATAVTAWGVKVARKIRRGEVACFAASAAFLGCGFLLGAFFAYGCRAASSDIIRAGNEFCKDLTGGNCSAESLDVRCASLQPNCIEPLQFDSWHACVCSTSVASSTGSGGTLRGSGCNDWDNDGSESWCLVNAGIGCGNVTLDDASGQYRSAGPCSDEVESRSQASIDGLQAFDRVMWSAIATALLLFGLSAVAVHACGCCGGGRDSYDSLQSRSLVAEDVRDGLVVRFESAQQLAVRRMKNTTPEQMRMNLYSFYMQATRGDAKGPPFENLSRHEMTKYDAWSSARGMTSEEAMQRYIDVVNGL